jgi:hypothetical protein
MRPTVNIDLFHEVLEHRIVSNKRDLLLCLALVSITSYMHETLQ